MKRIILAVFLLPMMHAAAQLPEVQMRSYPLVDDSVRVAYALPAGNPVRPAVIVLHDRFGLQSNVHTVLKVLARMGFRAYAPELRSLPLTAVSGMPGFSLDSTDAEMVTQVSVDVLNEEGCSGSIGLLAFDAGALVAMDVITRFPFFRSAALFYPPTDAEGLARLLEAKAVLQLHVAQFDPLCSLAAVNGLRERFMEAGKRLHVLYYKEAYPLFVNPEHENWHKTNTQSAWNHLLKMLRGTL